MPVLLILLMTHGRSWVFFRRAQWGLGVGVEPPPTVYARPPADDLDGGGGQ